MPNLKKMTEAEEWEHVSSLLIKHLRSPDKYPYKQLLEETQPTDRQRLSDKRVTYFLRRKKQDAELLFKEGRYNPELPIVVSETFHSLGGFATQILKQGPPNNLENAKVQLTNSQTLKTMLESVRLAADIAKQVMPAPPSDEEVEGWDD